MAKKFEVVVMEYIEGPVIAKWYFISEIKAKAYANRLAYSACGRADIAIAVFNRSDNRPRYKNLLALYETHKNQAYMDKL